MTDHSESLVDALLNTALAKNNGCVSMADIAKHPSYIALAHHIEELERKAQECDDLKAANKRLAKYHADHP